MVFGTPWDLYEFIWMLFGLHRAEAMFQCLMDHILASHAGYATAYIDDIVVFMWARHKRSLWAVLSELWGVGMMVSSRKCALAQRQTKYLGFLVRLETMRPLANKVEAIYNFATPQNSKQLQFFLGLANYYRQFVPFLRTGGAPHGSLEKTTDGGHKMDYRDDMQFQAPKEGPMRRHHDTHT